MTRHLWLVQLQNLDQAYAPDLPPHIKVDTLSYHDLRTLVVNAVRSYESLSRGMAHYVQRASVVPGIQGYRFGEILTPKLSPGGQYLFIQWTENTLQIFDLYDNDACVWTYDKPEFRFTPLLKFTFEINADRTITILIVIQSS